MFLKGILIGLIFGVPAGAVGAMTVQRTWEHGIKAGLLTGMGSSVADCIYAAIGAFGLTIISDFLLQYQTAIPKRRGGSPGSVWKGADSFQKMNRIFGVVLSLFGILVFIRAIPI